MSKFNIMETTVAKVHAAYLDGTKFTAEQIRFIHLIVDELTTNGIVEAARLYESPYTDHAPTGPESVFAEGDVDAIVEILDGLADDPKRLLTRDERRLLQRYSATLPRRGADPLVEVVAPGVQRWSGEYDASRGIVLDGGLTTW